MYAINSLTEIKTYLNSLNSIYLIMKSEQTFPTDESPERPPLSASK